MKGCLWGHPFKIKKASEYEFKGKGRETIE